MSAPQIQPVDVAPETFEKLWGVKVYDYMIDKEPVDFETLLVRIASKRATIVENEIGPVSKIVTRRNAQLKELGDALADLSRAQALFTEQSKSEDTQSVSSKTAEVLSKISTETIISADNTVTKANCEMAIQLVKSKMEKHNNDSQSDTTRLQGLISKRDGAFDTASSLLKNVSDSRSNSIRNMLTN